MENQSYSPTQQDLNMSVEITEISSAKKILNIVDDISIPSMLTSFEKQINVSIETSKTRMLKPLTEAKNIILRHIIETMIANTGRFDLTGSIPFKQACISCRGTGETYKFFRSAEEVPCKRCNEAGYLFIPCRTCKGSGRYKKPGLDVECTRCYKDPKTGEASGKEKVKCASCRGKGVFRKLVLDAKIKETTHCHDCKGRGFILPEPETKTANKRPARVPHNPVISETLGKQILAAEVKE